MKRPLKFPSGGSLSEAIDIIAFSNSTGIDATHVEQYLHCVNRGRISEARWFSLVDYKRAQKYMERRWEVATESDRYNLDPYTFRSITEYLMANKIDYTSVTEQVIKNIVGEIENKATVGVVYPIFNNTVYVIRQRFNFHVVIEQLEEGRPKVVTEFSIFSNPWDNQDSLSIIRLHDNLAKFFGLKRTNRIKLWWNVVKRALKVH